MLLAPGSSARVCLRPDTSDEREFFVMKTSWERIRNAWNRWRQPAWRGWLIDGALVVLVFSAVAAYQTRRHLGSGTAAPDILLRELGGEVTRLSDLHGKPVVMLWWAPWCGVCGQESGTWSSFTRTMGKDAHVISVAADYASIREVRAFMQKNGVDYPVLLASPEARDAFGVDQYPSIYFLDAEGRVVRSVVGYTTSLGLYARALLAR